MPFEPRSQRFKSWMALPPADTKQLMKDTAWADGLRGIASLFVVASHLVLCFARKVVLPCCGDDTTRQPLLFQRPVFRLIGMGHSWVAVFFILLGFVNALKPLKLARQRRADTALASLAVSAFRRTFRLVLPATAATVLSWFVCQFGAYEAARNGDAYWMYTYTPSMSTSWASAVGDLFTSLKATWQFQGPNAYDQPQWALIFLLQGSMMVFTALLMTVNLTPRWRCAVLVLFVAWSLDLSWELRDPLVGATVFAGLLLAELTLSDLPLRLAHLSPLLSTLFILSGLLFMSEPSDFTDQTRWSDIIHKWGVAHFPAASQGEIHRTWGSLGAVLMILGILLSPHARRFLAARPFVWLGRISFPVYLLHGTFVRSVLAWLCFQSTPVPFPIDDKGNTVLRYPQRSEPALWAALAVSMGLMLLAAHAWTARVEPFFGRVTKAAEDLMMGKSSDGVNGGMILPTRKE